MSESRPSAQSGNPGGRSAALPAIPPPFQQGIRAHDDQVPADGEVA